jgi:lipopolysaccharide transport system ATP-binding protein
MGAVANLCTRGVVLLGGQVHLDLQVERAVQGYLATLNRIDCDPFLNNPERRGNGLIRLTSARILNHHHEAVSSLISGTPVCIEFEYENPHCVSRAVVGCTIYNHLGIAVSHMNMSNSGDIIEPLGKMGAFLCVIPNLPLPVGDYRVAVIVNVDKGIADWLPNALTFAVEGSVFFQSGRTPSIEHSTCLVRHKWKHIPS